MIQTAVEVKEIAFTGYPAKDLKRARAFYETVFNLKPSMIAEDGCWVEYDINGAAFFIGQFSNWAPSVAGPSMAFEVEDIHQVIAQLKEQHIPIITEPFQTPGCWIAIVSDSEENSLMLHQRTR